MANRERHLLIATGNPNKLREIRQLLVDVPVTLHSLAELPPVAEPEETGHTFQENALLKARQVARVTGVAALGDDTGLEVAALDGAPGVTTARFAGPDGLVRQFQIGTVVVGESVNFAGGLEWLREHGVRVVDLGDEACIRLLADFIALKPEVWNEDIGEE